MKVITFTAIKGGVGKSSLAILTANYLSRLNYKVLCIDLDIQNSLSFYFFPEYNQDNDNKNIANAFFSEDLKSNIIKDLFIDVIQSNFNLIKLKTLSDNTLSRLLNQVKDDYDFIIIDTAPTIDNIVFNAIKSSDLIITPTFLSLFDYKALLFFQSEIQKNTDKLDNWQILFNRFRDIKTDNPENEKNQYIDLFQSTFNNILNSKIPDTTIIQKAIDTKEVISKAKAKKKLYNAFKDFIKEIVNIDIQPDNF
jgi:chromosome partitioning protein